MSYKEETVDSALARVKEWIVNPAKVADLTTRVFRTKGKVPRSDWSPFNQFLTFAAGTSDGRSRNQWARVDRYINKDANPFWIFKPIIAWVYIGDDQETGKKQYRQQFTNRYTLIQKFRVEDTTGKELPREDIPPKKLPPLMEIANLVLDAPVQWKAAERSIYGYYRTDENKITLMSDHVGVFFHEIGHAIHKKLDKSFEKRDRPYKELVAELSAMALSVLYSPEHVTPNWSFNYVKDWAGGEKPLIDRLPQAFGMVGKVVDYVHKLAKN